MNATPTLLSGINVAVTAARKAEELIELLHRQGATVIHAPTLQSISIEDRPELKEAIQSILDDPIDYLVVTTGVGFKTLMHAARKWKVEQELLQRFASCTIITRGPKATGAVRGEKLKESWSPASATSADIVKELLAQGVDRKRIAVQQHGATAQWDPHINAVDCLLEANAQVIALPVYQWQLPEETAPISALIDDICAHKVDMITFTSAPAVLSMFDIACKDNRYDEFVSALCHNCLAVSVGPVTGEPLAERNIPYIMPERSRMTAMVKAMTHYAAEHITPRDSQDK